jgi:hypothetical protein
MYKSKNNLSINNLNININFTNPVNNFEHSGSILNKESQIEDLGSLKTRSKFNYSPEKRKTSKLNRRSEGVISCSSGNKGNTSELKQLIGNLKIDSKLKTGNLKAPKIANFERFGRSKDFDLRLHNKRNSE